MMLKCRMPDVKVTLANAKDSRLQGIRISKTRAPALVNLDQARLIQHWTSSLNQFKEYAKLSKSLSNLQTLRVEISDDLMEPEPQIEYLHNCLVDNSIDLQLLHFKEHYSHHGFRIYDW